MKKIKGIFIVAIVVMLIGTMSQGVMARPYSDESLEILTDLGVEVGVEVYEFNDRKDPEEGGGFVNLRDTKIYKEGDRTVQKINIDIKEDSKIIIHYNDKENNIMYYYISDFIDGDQERLDVKLKDLDFRELYIPEKYGSGQVDVVQDELLEDSYKYQNDDEEVIYDKKYFDSLDFLEMENSYHLATNINKMFYKLNLNADDSEWVFQTSNTGDYRFNLDLEGTVNYSLNDRTENIHLIDYKNKNNELKYSNAYMRVNASISKDDVYFLDYKFEESNQNDEFRFKKPIKTGKYQLNIRPVAGFEKYYEGYTGELKILGDNDDEETITCTILGDFLNDTGYCIDGRDLDYCYIGSESKIDLIPGSYSIAINKIVDESLYFINTSMYLHGDEIIDLNENIREISLNIDNPKNIQIGFIKTKCRYYNWDDKTIYFKENDQNINKIFTDQKYDEFTIVFFDKSGDKIIGAHLIEEDDDEINIELGAEPKPCKFISSFPKDLTYTLYERRIELDEDGDKVRKYIKLKTFDIEEAQNLDFEKEYFVDIKGKSDDTYYDLTSRLIEYKVNNGQLNLDDYCYYDDEDEINIDYSNLDENEFYLNIEDNQSYDDDLEIYKEIDDNIDKVVTNKRSGYCRYKKGDYWIWKELELRDMETLNFDEVYTIELYDIDFEEDEIDMWFENKIEDDNLENQKIIKITDNNFIPIKPKFKLYSSDGSLVDASEYNLYTKNNDSAFRIDLDFKNSKIDSKYKIEIDYSDFPIEVENISFEAVDYSDYERWPSIEVEEEHTFTIEMNKEVDINSVNDENIMLMDDYYRLIPTNISLSEDKKSITIDPKDDLNEKYEYCLYIKDLRSADNILINHKWRVDIEID